MYIKLYGTKSKQKQNKNNKNSIVKFDVHKNLQNEKTKQK
jgi:hypothetical protein